MLSEEYKIIYKEYEIVYTTNEGIVSIEIKDNETGKIYHSKFKLFKVIKELQQENQELKKQIEEKENIACNWKDSCLENAGKIEKLENQQKEFIEYLRNLSNWYDADGVKQGMVNGILNKYKEIIGGKE